MSPSFRKYRLPSHQLRKLSQVVGRRLFRKVRKLSLEHRVGQFRSRSLRHFLSHCLVELTLKHLLTATTVKISRFANGRPHRFQHLPIKRFADELRELFMHFLFAAALRMQRNRICGTFLPVALESRSGSLGGAMLRQPTRKSKHGRSVRVSDRVRSIDHMVTFWLTAKS